MCARVLVDWCDTRHTSNHHQQSRCGDRRPYRCLQSKAFAWFTLFAVPFLLLLLPVASLLLIKAPHRTTGKSPFDLPRCDAAALVCYETVHFFSQFVCLLVQKFSPALLVAGSGTNTAQNGHDKRINFDLVFFCIFYSAHSDKE